jgi:hypothetical protein
MSFGPDWRAEDGRKGKEDGRKGGDERGGSEKDLLVTVPTGGGERARGTGGRKGFFAGGGASTSPS